MKHEVKERLLKVGTKILQNSRNELYLSMRFLDLALSQLSYEMNQQTFYVGTDGWKIYYNPRFLMERFSYHPVQVNRAYLHMLLHCIFHHMYQEEQQLDEELWNLSCDIAIEYIIDGFEYKATKQLITDYRAKWYEKLENLLKVFTAEGIYKLLSEGDLKGQDMVKLSLEFLVDDHSFWKGKKENEDEEEPSSNQPKPESKAMLEMWKNVGEKTKTNLETFAKNIGSETGGLLRALKIQQRRRYDYKTFLRKFAVLRENMQVDDDAFDPIFYTYGLTLYQNMPLIEAMEYKEVKKVEEFVIAIDTSGSCSGQLVQTFLEETVSILMHTESFHKKVNVHIIQCDNEIREDYTVTSLEDLKQYKDNFQAKGFGGTDFRPVFAYTNQLMKDNKLKQLKGLIYFTDGFGTFPNHRPPYDTAFVFLKEDYTDAMVPPWAMKLALMEDEIQI